MRKYLVSILLLIGLTSFITAEQHVRIQLADNLKKAAVKTSGKVYIYAATGGKKYKVSQAENLTISLDKGQLQVGAFSTTGPMVLEPAKNTLLTFQKNTYTGKLYFIVSGNTFKVVEYTNLENYLLGVLPYEMSYSWPLEALKAQAVAARTYTRMQLKSDTQADFDLYNDVRSQMYKGSGKVYDSVRQAVENTRGQVLTYKKELFNTYYHANCGGGTDDAKIWTGSDQETIKPLKGASCSTDEHSPSYSWKATIPAKSITGFVNKNGLAGNIKKIKVSKKTSTKRAVNLQFTTSKANKEISCAKFRLAIGASLLKSCKITSISKSGNNFNFQGHGYGHGIGMCQDGAKGMAENGKTYKQILSHYFPSADLTTL